jgi:hypothetical protein
MMITLATRFLLELAGVGAVAWLGTTAPVDGPARAVVVVAAPIALVVAWGLVVAPKADNPLPLRARELIGTGLLLLVAGALALAGQPVPAAAFATVVVVNQVLLVALGPGTAVAARLVGPTA